MDSTTKAADTKASQKSSKSTKSKVGLSKEPPSSAAGTLGSKGSSAAGTGAKGKRSRPGASKAAASDTKTAKPTEDEAAAETTAAANKELASSAAVVTGTQADSKARPRAKTSATKPGSAISSQPAVNEANSAAPAGDKLTADASRQSGTVGKGRKACKEEVPTTEAAKVTKASREVSSTAGAGAGKLKAKKGAAPKSSQDGGGAAAVPNTAADVKVADAPEAVATEAITSPTGPKEKSSILQDITGGEASRRRERRRKSNRRKSLLVPAGIAKVLRKTMRRQGAGEESESSLSSREELSIMLVGTLAIFFFCFLVGLLFYYFFTGPNLPIAVACISDECLQAKEDLDNLLNDAKKPCADFYGHVCDSWSNTTSSFHAGIAGRQLAKMNASLFQNVKIKRDEDRRYGVHLLRPVYRKVACIAGLRLLRSRSRDGITATVMHFNEGDVERRQCSVVCYFRPKVAIPLPGGRRIARAGHLSKLSDGSKNTVYVDSARPVNGLAAIVAASPPRDSIASSLYSKQSCYRYMSESVQLKDALKEAHELLEINELLNAASFFDVVRYLVRQVMQIGVYTVFKAMFVHESGRTALFMSRGYTLQEKLGVSFHTGEARKRFEQILKFGGRKNVAADLSLLAEMDAKVDDIFRRIPMKEEQLPLRSVVARMVSGVTPEQWVLAFKGSQREVTVLEPGHEIITQGSQVFRKAMQMVVKRGLRNATFYLATSLEADVVYILSMKDTIAQSEVYKALYCLGFTYKCLTLTWAFLAARHLAEPRSIGVLQDILGAMQEAVSEERDAFVWMEEATRNKTAAALSKLSVHVIAGKAFNVTSVDYNKPDVKLDVDENFLKVLVTALKLHHSVMSAKPPTRVEMLVSELEFRGALSLIPIMEYIVVPTLYQRDPYLYNYHVPDYFNYGTMGGLLGAQLAETVGVAVNDDRQSTWDPATATKHGELLRCLTERRRHLGFPDFHPATADQQQTQMVTLSISARLAYSGLKRVFRKKSRTVKVFNDYWPEALRVFFSRFCLLWCSGSLAADPLTSREKCVLPLYNMEEFAELYNCDANSTGGAVCPT